MSSYDYDILSTKIKAIREIYSFIDNKIAAFVDEDTKCENATKQIKELENKFKGKEFVVWCLIASFVLLIPMCIATMIVSIPVYLFTPVIAAILVYFYAENYRKKKLPPLLQAAKEQANLSYNERIGLANVICQSNINIKADIKDLLTDTDDEDFLMQLSGAGIPLECENIMALDYMYCAIARKLAHNLPDAITHFITLKNSLVDKNSDEAKDLYDKISYNDLLSEYRRGVIKRCENLKEEHLTKAAE